MSAAAKKLGQELASGIQGAAEARWLAVGTVVSGDPLRVLVDDTEISAASINVGSSLFVGEQVLVACLRGRPSVSFVVIGKIQPPSYGPVFTLRGDTIRIRNLATASALTSFASVEEAEELVWSEEASPAASVVLGANGHYYLKMATEDSGPGTRLLYETAPSWVVDLRSVPIVDGIVHAWIVCGFLGSTPETSARAELVVGDYSLGAYVYFTFLYASWSASVSSMQDFGEGGGVGSFTSAPPIFGTTAVIELELAIDGELIVRVNNDVVTPDSVSYPDGGMVPLSDTEMLVAATISQDAQEFRLYEAVVDATPMTEDQRSARTAALMATYL